MNKKKKGNSSDVELIEGTGSKTHGGGKEGHYWHIYYKETRAGRVYINWIEDEDNELGHAAITIELNQNFRGRGIGSICFRKACELSQYDTVYAEMRKNNIASQKAATRAGFKLVNDYKGRQIKMVWMRR